MRRKNTRASLELAEKVSRPRELYDADSEQIGHIAQKYALRVLNPIIDWTDAEIWEFIKAYNMIEKAKAEGKRVTWKTPEEVMKWWLRE